MRIYVYNKCSKKNVRRQRAFDGFWLILQITEDVEFILNYYKIYIGIGIGI